MDFIDFLKNEIYSREVVKETIGGEGNKCQKVKKKYWRRGEGNKCRKKDKKTEGVGGVKLNYHGQHSMSLEEGFVEFLSSEVDMVCFQQVVPNSFIGLVQGEFFLRVGFGQMFPHGL